jgi:hypothetical protein
MRTPPVFAALSFVFLAVGCSSGTDSGDGSTFACGTGASATNCAYNTHYCLLTTQGGVTTLTCVVVPTACAGAGSPCSCVNAMYTGGPSCVSFNANGLRATTVSISR